MIPLLTRLRFYLYSHATDMRKSFDGLSGIVTSALARDPTSGDVYIFLNRRRDRMKLLLWSKLEQYFADGRLEIDNNLVENAIRPVALGRKNYLFAGSHESAKRAGMIYTLIAELLPQNWHDPNS